MSREDRAREAIEKRALGAMLNDAFFTWPSAVNIAFSFIMYFLAGHLFPWWQPWFWIVFGAVAEVIYLVATLTDPVASQQAVNRMLTERFDPGTIRNLSARQSLEKALEYKKNIDAYVALQTGAMKVQLTQTANEINDWIDQIYRLAKSIDLFEANSIIDRDRRAVPSELENLKRRLAIETDPAVKAELQEAVGIRQKLMENLQTIANSAKRTEIKLDSTVAQLSTVYAQLQLLDTRGLDSGRAQRLRSQIQEEIASLSDTISAMDDVYKYGTDQGSSVDTTRLADDSDATGMSDTSDTSSRRAGRGTRNG